MAAFANSPVIPQRPFPQHATYAPGTIKPAHRTQTQLDDDVRAFYDTWKSRYVIQAGTTLDGHSLYRISFGSTNPDRTVSEGQGYGMIIVALMAGYDPNAQTIFDGLWTFSHQYPSSNNPRLMAWEVPPGNTGSAFDGDADIAYGLLLADAQWGSKTGRINYAAEATAVISAILKSTIGPNSRLPMLGDWVDPDGSPYNQYTPRSSDFMLDHFRAFGRFSGDPAWNAVVANVQNVVTRLQTDYSPTTGLLPDFIIYQNGQFKPAPAFFLEGAHDGEYSYNAGRNPWRLGTDALLSNDPITLAQVQKISHWIQAAAGNNPYGIRPGYQLSGQPFLNNDYFTTFFVAPFGVAAMTNPGQQQWLNAIYDAVYNTYEDYYEDTVTLLALLVMTGNYWPLLPDSGAVASSLITHYYQAILGRAPEASGLSYWLGEVVRVQGLGIDIQEAFRVMAGQFFTSDEYLNQNTNDPQYVTDLYETFFDRDPDTEGLSYWTGQLTAGLPRSVVLFHFLFSDEFAVTMQSLFGNTASRSEISAVVDFYRGFLNRSPENEGFNYWLNRFRTAQCQGASSVTAEVERISAQFMASAEYTGRQRDNPDFVADLYYAFLRRGSEWAGFNYWVNQLDSNALTRDAMRRAFVQTPEFQNRVNQIINEGCVN
jgi:endo-1,4-beta-D-glucanase Y